VLALRFGRVAPAGPARGQPLALPEGIFKEKKGRA